MRGMKAGSARIFSRQSLSSPFEATKLHKYLAIEKHNTLPKEIPDILATD